MTIYSIEFDPQLINPSKDEIKAAVNNSNKHQVFSDATPRMPLCFGEFKRLDLQVVRTYKNETIGILYLNPDHRPKEDQFRVMPGIYHDQSQPVELPEICLVDLDHPAYMVEHVIAGKRHVSGVIFFGPHPESIHRILNGNPQP